MSSSRLTFDWGLYVDTESSRHQLCERERVRARVYVYCILDSSYIHTAHDLIDWAGLLPSPHNIPVSVTSLFLTISFLSEYLMFEWLFDSFAYILVLFWDIQNKMALEIPCNPVHLKCVIISVIKISLKW